MLESIFNELLALFKGVNLIALTNEQIEQNGNYLVFSSAQNLNNSEQSFNFTIYAAANMLDSKNSLGVLLSRVDEICALTKAIKANSLKCANASVISLDSLKLYKENAPLFIYEIALNVRIRL